MGRKAVICIQRIEKCIAERILKGGTGERCDGREGVREIGRGEA